MEVTPHTLTLTATTFQLISTQFLKFIHMYNLIAISLKVRRCKNGRDD